MSLAGLKGTVKKVVLAYSGGLDTSCILPWLIETYGCEVIAYTANVGQDDELDGLERKALASGASKVYIEDLRAEFVRDFVFPTLRAGAIYERQYLLGTSMARPLIAKRLAEIAIAEGADAIAHGATGKGNDQVRFELGVMAHAPDTKIIAPWRIWSIRSREDALAYAEAHGVPATSFGRSIYSRDRNLWHVSHEGNVLEDLLSEPEEAMYQLTVSPERAPDVPAYVEITFESGVPVRVDGQDLDPVALLEKLNTIAAAHGVGRLDIVENRLVGIKSRGAYETPGGTLLVCALRGLEQICLDRETQAFKDAISEKYARIVYDGQWFTPLREALEAFVKEAMKDVTGRVRVKLYKGSCTVVGRESPFSLYSKEFATFGADDVYNQSLADGFIKLFGLPIKLKAMIKSRGSGVSSCDTPRPLEQRQEPTEV